jgi:hypothetical protein
LQHPDVGLQAVIESLWEGVLRCFAVVDGDYGDVETVGPLTGVSLMDE